jgi:hypothetical protein
VPEDSAKDSKRDKARSIAFSMKLVNGVYNKLIEVFGMQLQEENGEDYIRGWNDALNAAITMTRACKYTKKDYKEMLLNETTGDNVQVPEV